MRSLLLFLLLLCCHLASGQERIVSGRLTGGDDDLPLPQVSIFIKGTTIGTVTDAEGYYSLQAPIGSILIFRYIGYVSREVRVTEESLVPLKSGGKWKKEKKKKVSDKKKSKQTPYWLAPNVINGPGIATLTDSASTHKIKEKWQVSRIKSIKKTKKGVKVKKYAPSYSSGGGFNLDYTTSFTFENVIRLPALQKDYAQGRNLNNMLRWQGPDVQEQFSWGPNLSTLNFDGSNYPYDQNGALINGGSGNPAQAYDVLSFFRTGLSFSNQLSIYKAVSRANSLKFQVGQFTRRGIIPNAEFHKLNVSAELKNFRISEESELNLKVGYDHSTGNLIQRGANLSTIIGSVYSTPVTFDNANGVSAKSAISNPIAYTLADGNIRSYAPGIADNPYGQAATMPDEEESERLYANLRLKYRPESWLSFQIKGQVDVQSNMSAFGIANGYSGAPIGRLTQREDQQTFADGQFLITAADYTGSFHFQLMAGYQTQYFDRQIERTNAFGLTNFDNIESAAVLQELDQNLSRQIHEVIFNGLVELSHGINIRLANRTYFSNTADSESYTNLFPSLNAEVDLRDLLFISGIDYLNILISGGRSLREADLVYNNWSYASTNLPVESYRTFYEATDLTFPSGLTPETAWNFEASTEIRLHAFSASASYFNTTTSNFIAPDLEENNFTLDNLANVINRGGSVSLSYNPYWGGDFNLESKLRWSTYNTKVKELIVPESRIALAGFSEVQTSLVAGQPLGAIYGSTYQRTDTGERLIGADGFPVKNETLSRIGNPIPDWILGWDIDFTWKYFSLRASFEYKHGGDIWNGTRAMLDYLGRSAETEELRNTTGFVFDGVTDNGQPNTTALDFYNPNRPLTANRWVRYGPDGIAEAYIEDASAFRLNQLTLNCRLPMRKSKVDGIDISLTATNLFIISSYSGAEPASSLFNYNTGNGLDLFNIPSTRSYSLSLSIQL